MHHAAIKINPQWDEQDFARAREWLITKLAQYADAPRDTVAQNTTFERKANAVGDEYIATYTPPSRPYTWAFVESIDVPR